MRSKTSFFSKAFFISDIKRYWWLLAANTALLILCCVIPVYDRCLNAVGYSYGDEPTWLGVGIVINIVFSLGVGTILWTFMHFGNSVSTFHAMPVKRSCIFTTKMVSGLVILLAPILINGLIFTLLSFTPVCFDHFSVIDALKWTYQGIIYGLIIFSLTTAVNMMTGNPIGTIVFTGGFAILPLMVLAFFEGLFSQELYGYYNNLSDYGMDKIYIGPEGIASLEYGFIYPVASVILLAGAYILYKYRKSESNGEVIAFKWLIPVFIGIIAAIASGIGYAYFWEIVQIESIFTLIPFGIVGTAIAYMISKKSLKLKGTLKPIGVYLVLTLCFIAAVRFDITGFEDRIPSIEDIEGVSIDHSRYYVRDEARRDKPMFTDREDIEAVIRLHKSFIKDKAAHENRSEGSLPITYYLKNDKKVTRMYLINSEIDTAYLKPVYETPEYRASRFGLLNDKDYIYTMVEVNDRRIGSDTYITLYPDNEDMQKLIDAVKLDMQNTSYEDMLKNYEASTNVYISWTMKEKDTEETEDLLKSDVYANSEAYAVKSTSVNTIKVLEELGFYDMIPAAEDISEIKMALNPKRTGKVVVEMTINTPEEIAEIYSEYDEMIKGYHFHDYEGANIDINLMYTLKNGHQFGVSATYDRKELPETFSKYIK